MAAGFIDTILFIPRILLSICIVVFLILLVPTVFQSTEPEREWERKHELRQNLQAWTQSELSAKLPVWVPGVTSIQVRGVNLNSIDAINGDRIWADKLGIQDPNIKAYDCDCIMVWNGRTYSVFVFIFAYIPYTSLDQCGVLVVDQASANVLYGRKP